MNQNPSDLANNSRHQKASGSIRFSAKKDPLIKEEYDLLVRIEKNHLSQQVLKVNLEDKYFQHRVAAFHFGQSICSRLNLPSAILHSGLQLMDRFNQHIEVDPALLKIVLVSCIWIAAKFEMDYDHVPSMEQLVTAAGNLIDATIVNKLELHILNILEWHIMSATCIHFLQNYLKHIPELQQLFHTVVIGQQVTLLNFLSKRIGEALHLLKLPPSKVAACLFHLAWAYYFPNTVNMEMLHDITGYQDSQLKPYIQEVEGVWKTVTSVSSKRISPRSTLEADESSQLLCEGGKGKI